LSQGDPNSLVARFLSAPVASGWSGLSAKILRVLESGEATSRDEIQRVTGASRSSVTNALAELLDAEAIVATASPHSPHRRYRIS
jgi:DNA-binding transcriptional ArsR family regulator